VIYLIGTLLYVWRCRDYYLLPFVIAFIYGFGYVAFLSFRTALKNLI
jgi:hypothetical protein